MVHFSTIVKEVPKLLCNSCREYILEFYTIINGEFVCVDCTDSCEQCERRFLRDDNYTFICDLCYVHSCLDCCDSRHFLCNECTNDINEVLTEIFIPDLANTVMDWYGLF